MQKIYQYPLKMTAEQKVILPFDSQCLSVENQNEQLVLYALINTDTGLEDKEHTIKIVGTGTPCPDVFLKYFIGTVQFQNGNLVFHVFSK
jgi:hypothetical protein